MVNFLSRSGIDLQMNYYALLGCIVSDREPNYMMAQMGLVKQKSNGIKKMQRDDSIYIEWQRQIDSGSTYKAIAEANKISYKTVGNCLVNWRKRNAKNGVHNNISNGRFVRRLD